MAGKTLADEWAEDMGLPPVSIGPREERPPGVGIPRVDVSGKAIRPYAEPSEERYGDPDARARQRGRFETGVEIAGAMGGAGAGPWAAKKATQMGLKMAPAVGRALGAGFGEAGVRQFTYDEEEGDRTIETGKAFARGALGEAIGIAGNKHVLEPIGGRIVGFANRAESFTNPLARAVTKPLRRSVNPFHGKLDLGAEEALAQLRPHGVSPSPGQLSTSGWIDRFENVIDASMTGQGRIRAQRGQASDVAESMVKDYVESFTRQASRADSGELLGAALDNSVEIFRAAEKQNYRAVGRAIPEGRDGVQIKRLLGVAKIHRKKVANLGKGMGAERKKLLDDILLTEPKTVPKTAGGSPSIKGERFTRPEEISWQKASDLRSALLARERSATDPLASQTEGIVKQLVKVLDHQMGLTARNASPAAYDLWRKAGAFTKAGKTGINNRVMKSMQNQIEPERVYSSVVQNGVPTRIKKVRKYVEEGVGKGKTDPLTWEVVQGHWMDDAIRFSVDPKTERISGEKLLTKIHQMGDERLGELFPVDRGRTFKQFARTLYIAQKSASPDDPMSVVVKMMQGGAVLSLVAAPVALGAFGGDSSSAAKAAIPTATLIVMGPVALSRFFTNPKAVRMLTTGMTHGPTTGTARTMGQLLTHLDNILPAGSAYIAKEPGSSGTTQQPEQDEVPSITELVKPKE